MTLTKAEVSQGVLGGDLRNLMNVAELEPLVRKGRSEHFKYF